jgi:hypothetical protein
MQLIATVYKTFDQVDGADSMSGNLGKQYRYGGGDSRRAWKH